MYKEPGERPVGQTGRVAERPDRAQMGHANRPVTEDGVRTEQTPRRYVPGAGYQEAVPRRRVDAPAPAAYVTPSGRAARDREDMPNEMRRADFASERKLRALWSVFGILAVLLVAAIIYEVVLGNGLKETGNQRMAGQSGTQTAGQTNAQTTVQTNAQTTAQTNAQTTAQTNAQTAAQTNAASTAQTSATDAGTAEAADGSDDAADSAADDIPTIPLEGDDVPAEAADGAE